MGLSKNILLVGAMAVAASIAANVALRRSRRFSFSGKSVVVAGGSRGLGLVLARALVDQGARVAVLARTQADLDAAARELELRGGEAIGLRCDVRDPAEVRAAVEQVLGRFGGVDVLFNVAGVIQVGPLEAMTPEDFELAMDTHFWGPLYTTMEVLPAMRARRWGRIVNIASMGGKRAVPHMAPYTASKFALVGLSGSLRAELVKHGILVTTVCPSVIRTGSTRNAIYKGQHRKEHAWFSVASSAPLVAMPAEEAAAKILRACRDGERELILHTKTDLSAAAHRLFPGAVQSALALFDRLLPAMGGIREGWARGYESGNRLSPSVLTRLGDEAAERNNEMRRR